jgi:anti-sigma B factor antagonist
VNINYETCDGVATLAVSGELDIAAVPRLREMAELASTEPNETIRINLARVTFIDSSGIGALVVIKNNAEHEHRVLLLDEPSEPVLRLLGITGLTQHFRITSS